MPGMQGCQGCQGCGSGWSWPRSDPQENSNPQPWYEHLTSRWSEFILLAHSLHNVFYALNLSKYIFRALIKQRVKDQFIQHWYTDINNNELYYNYCMYKNRFEFDLAIAWSIGLPIGRGTSVKLKLGSNSLLPPPTPLRAFFGALRRNFTKIFHFTIISKKICYG